MITMDIDSVKFNEIYTNIDNYIDAKFNKYSTYYVELGALTVRLVCYSEEFIPHIKKQLMYVSEKADKYDATIILWKEDDIKNFQKILHKDFDPKYNLKLRIEMLSRKDYKNPDIRLYNRSVCKTNPIFDVSVKKGIIQGSRPEKNTYYYGVANLDPEEFIKEGHLFVQLFNKILKTPSTNLVHGAVAGVNNTGVLFCARGQRGKSTLTVLSMIRGFEYVSDDYLVLEKDGDNLYADPIYSIITLSPKMYNELYDDLKGCRFVSNNARKDKYVFNIANFGDRFRKKYPIKVCIFPEIVSDPEPSIKPCAKGRAITQLIQSTVSQMRDLNDHNTIKKIIDMVKGYEFYKLNLCYNIEKNTIFLKNFLENFDKRERKIVEEDSLWCDITFGVANFLDSKTGAIYTMNEFATTIYEKLLNGESKSDILEEIRNIQGVNTDIERCFNNFVNEVEEMGLLSRFTSENRSPVYDIEILEKKNFKISFKKFAEDGTIELTKKENK